MKKEKCFEIKRYSKKGTIDYFVKEINVDTVNDLMIEILSPNTLSIVDSDENEIAYHEDGKIVIKEEYIASLYDYLMQRPHGYNVN